METVPKVFKKICLSRGTADLDLFASRVSYQMPQYMSWKLDPCIPNKLESNLRLHFPPFLITESIAESSTRPSFRDFNNSSMANTVMVAWVTSHFSKNYPTAPRNKRSFDRSSRELPSTD